MFFLPPYLLVSKKQLVKSKFWILNYDVNKTYAKLAPNPFINKEIIEIMGYPGVNRRAHL